MFFVVPKAGLRVKDPATMTALPAEGKEVSESVYWTRRLAAGDVELKAENVAAAKRPVSSKTKDSEGRKA